MGMTPTHEKLQELSDEDLIHEYNQTARNTVVGINFYTEELARRRASRQNDEMIKINKSVKNMTVLITVLTVINVVLVAYTLLK